MGAVNHEDKTLIYKQIEENTSDYEKRRTIITMNKGVAEKGKCSVHVQSMIRRIVKFRRENGSQKILAVGLWVGWYRHCVTYINIIILTTELK